MSTLIFAASVNPVLYEGATPVYSQYDVIGGQVAERLFRDGLCLPSGSQLTEGEPKQVVDVIRAFDLTLGTRR